MLLFTTILSIKSAKKQKIIYVLFASIYGTICSFLIPKPFSNIASIIGMPIAIIIIFKASILKSIIAEFFPLICITLIETLISRICLIIFNVPYELSATIPIFRVTIALLIYFILYILYRLAKKFNFNITLLDDINKKNKRTIVVNTILAFISVATQFYLIGYYNDGLPTFVIALNIVSLFAYFFISIYSLTGTMKLETTTRDLEESKLYNKTLQILHDNMRAFRHDFSNIVAGIGGYVETNDMKGLKKYYEQLLEDCQRVNNLTALSPDVINNPAIYNVLANKYHKADELGITINLEIFLDLNTLHIKIYEFTRILGILMDNAIEATAECSNKEINVYIRKEDVKHRQLLIIENTFIDTNIDTEKLYEKGFSTKKGNTGLGLWEVRKLLKKNNNLNLFTSKKDGYFSQQLEIYY